jgi:hypothetical protein
MQVGVEPEFLGPGVKDGGKAGECAEALPPLGQFDECFGGSLEEQIIEDLTVFKEKRIEFMRQGNDYMEVAGRQ